MNNLKNAILIILIAALSIWFISEIVNVIH